MAGTLGKIYGVMMSNSGLTVAGLVQGQNGSNVTQASLDSIAYTVTRYAADGAATVTGTGSLTVSSVVFDAPVTTDPRYTLAGGFNFLATIPASCFTTRGLRHTIDIDFTPASGEPFRQVYEGVPL